MKLWQLLKHLNKKEKSSAISFKYYFDGYHNASKYGLSYILKYDEFDNELTLRLNNNDFLDRVSAYLVTLTSGSLKYEEVITTPLECGTEEEPSKCIKIDYANIKDFKGKDITVPIAFGVNPFAQLLVCIFFGIFLYYHRKTSLLTSFVVCVVIASFNFFITALMLFRQTYSFVYVILLFYLLIRVITSIFMNKISSYWLLSTIFVSFATVYSLLACTMMIICS